LRKRFILDGRSILGKPPTLALVLVCQHAVGFLRRFLRCFLVCGIHALQSDRHLIDLPGEFVVALLVVRCHRRIEIQTHIRRFNSEKERNGAVDPASSDFFSVDEDRARASGARLATVVDKIIADGDATGRQPFPRR
jgi:hypothetical protein